jgi:hypothetical protein
MRIPTDRASATVARMGRTLATIAAERGACTDQELLAAGFTRSDITRHGDAARTVAARITRPDTEPPAAA